MVWNYWLTGKISDKIGTCELELELPRTWRQKYNDTELIFAKITAKILITGHVITVSGAVKQFNLVDAADKTVKRWQVETKFPSPVGKHTVTGFHSEAELEKYFVGRTGVTLISGRLRLPRIRWGAFYWPPSQKALSRMQLFIDDFTSKGEEFDLTKFPFDEIEGTDLSAVYEPIWGGHPYEKENND